MISIEEERPSSIPLPTTRRPLRLTLLGACAALGAGCATEPPDTFTLSGDLPPSFAYVAAVAYEPEPGQTCTLDRRDTGLGFNNNWRTEYQPESQIPVRMTVKGCRLVVRRIKLEIHSAYGKDWGDISADDGVIIVRQHLEDRFKSTFNDAGEHTLYGQCEWWFRTMGPHRRIVKLLDCKNSNAEATRDPGKLVGAYTLDQLPGKTIRLVIHLAKEERPAIGKTWVKVPNGWKRCMGKSFEDQYAFCLGNHTDFSTFQMVDGRICTIYPGCTE